MLTPKEGAQYFAKQMQAKRLNLNFSQKTLSDRSGVSFGVLKKFERTGQISLTSFFKLALILGVLEEFKNLFNQPPKNLISLDQLLRDRRRKRGRQ